MENPKSYAQIGLKKSSSSGKTGYDISICNAGISEKLLTQRAEIALRVALKVEKQLG